MRQLFGWTFFVLLLWGKLTVAQADEDPVPALANTLAQRMRALPDCSLLYEVVSNSSQGPAIAITDHSSLEKETFEFCKQGEMFYIKGYDRDYKLKSQLSFDGKTYFCFIQFAQQSYLWVGSQKGVIKAEIFSKLLNSPLFASISPLFSSADDEFSHLVLGSSDFWVGHLAKFKVEKSSEGITFRRKVNSSKLEIIWSPDMSSAAFRPQDNGGREYGEFKVLDRFEPSGIPAGLPLSYYLGWLDGNGNPGPGCHLVKVAPASFKPVKGMKPSQFVIPTALADRTQEL